MLREFIIFFLLTSQAPSASTKMSLTKQLHHCWMPLTKQPHHCWMPLTKQLHHCWMPLTKQPHHCWMPLTKQLYHCWIWRQIASGLQCKCDLPVPDSSTFQRGRVMNPTVSSRIKKDQKRSQKPKRVNKTIIKSSHPLHDQFINVAAIKWPTYHRGSGTPKIKRH